jgi:RNA polymerase sigma factor (sigma-70 family)
MVRRINKECYLPRERPLDAAARLSLQDGTALVDDRDLLLRALSALAPRQRAVLVLRYWEGLSDAEIAAMMNCAIGTVRSQASRALDRLRQQAKPHPADGVKHARMGEQRD